jgi:esterase/lipase superfamily enzyme
MDKKQEQWRSPSLGKDMTIKVYGESGTPIIGLPTRGQKSDQWEEYGMTKAISYQLKNGYNQLFCIDSVDEESFLNEKVAPPKRLMRQRQFESYVVEEVVPFIRQHNTIPYLMIAGVDLGGYHAVNLALKHPLEFNKAIGISGLYNIKSFFGKFYSDGVYYNNPIDFVPNVNKQSLLTNIRQVDFRLISYASDQHKTDAEKMARVFRSKLIDNELDIWDIAPDEEWDIWQRMLKTHII